MRISRKSRTTRNDHRFRSRFDGAEGLFPLRQYMRCRDELVHRIVMTLVQTGFVIALTLLGISLHRMFASHGEGVPRWVEPVALAAVLFVILQMMRRAVASLRELRDLRGELHRLKQEVAELDDRA